MVINRASAQYASTTGLNLLTPTRNKEGEENPLIGRKFKARGKGLERDGKDRYNEFEITGFVPVKSNRTFTVVKAKTFSGFEVELPIHFNARFLVPVNQK